MKILEAKYWIDVMAGRERGAIAWSLRGVLFLFEQPYALTMRIRNRLYDTQKIRIRTLPRPVVSVGNLTTGGTGKSPVVAWLAKQLIAKGVRPAVLLRGYRDRTRSDRQSQSDRSQSDEAREYEQLLGPHITSGGATIRAVTIRANADRVFAANQAIAHDPEINVFVLDDGMQHRRVARQCEIVLVDATDPFGHDHVLPRGLLREPMEGLRRADAIVLTRVDQAGSHMFSTSIAQIEAEIERHTNAPRFKCRHVITQFVDLAGNPVSLDHKRYFAFAGLGNPQPFFAQLLVRSHRDSATCVGTRTFRDHVRFESAEQFQKQVVDQAAHVSADIIITTRKNAAVMPSATFPIPILIAELAVEFLDDDDNKLIDLVLRKLRA